MAGNFPYVAQYTGGFSGGVEVHGMPVNPAFAGNVYWVDSATGSNGNKGTRNRPWATLDYAIGRCTANHGDVIMLYPNHAETITGAGGITADVAGISIIGLGSYNNRPRFLMDGGTTVTFVVTADDVTVQNCVFAAGHSDIATCFDVDAKGFKLIACEMIDNTTHENFLVGITSGSTTDNVCDGLTMVGNKFYTATDSHTAFATLVGDTDWMHIEGNIYMQGGPGGSAGAAGIFLNGTAGDDWGNILVKDNIINIHQTATDSYPLGGGNDQTDNTGIMVGNLIGCRIGPGTTGAGGQQIFTKGTGFHFIENWVADGVNGAAKRYPFPTGGVAAWS